MEYSRFNEWWVEAGINSNEALLQKEKIDISNPAEQNKLWIYSIDQLKKIELSKENFERFLSTPVEYRFDVVWDLKCDASKWECNYRNYYEHEFAPKNSPLVDVSEYWIKWWNYYYKRWIVSENELIQKYGEEKWKKYFKWNELFRKLVEEWILNDKCEVRLEIAERIREINRILKKYGYQIIIVSWYRSYLEQSEARKAYANQKWEIRSINHISKPWKSPHQSGGWIDIALADLEWNILNSKFKWKSPEKHSAYYWEILIKEKGRKGLSEDEIEAIKNTRIMFHMMTKIWWFIPHHKESWHFGFWDAMSEFIRWEIASQDLKRKIIIPAIYYPIQKIQN